MKTTTTETSLGGEETQTILASVLHGPQDLRLEPRLLPPPSPSELQVEIRATTICGSDLHYYRHFRIGDIAVQEPLTLGHESSGVVVGVGTSILPNDFKPGERVALEVGVPCSECDRCKEGRYNICAQMRFRSSARSRPHFQGTLQERVNHPADVAIHAVRRASLPAQGASVLIFGAGAIGLLCAAVCKAKGARNIMIVDTQGDRIHFATSQRFANNELKVEAKRGTSVEENLQVAKDTAERLCVEKAQGGFDVVMECTGAEGPTQTAIYAARSGGRVVLVGFGNPVQTLPISSAAMREVDIVGTFRYVRTYQEAIRMLEQGQLDQIVVNNLLTHRFEGLEGIEDAFKMASKTHDQDGRLVLKVLIEMPNNQLAW
ncbi:MAG: hypothetical protein OHK93_008387 [Ramalina farinacea]|uniref:Enoyl reductase (ER) domain-containing protein n=1 Tax=Ramalina farinacea TaxID=258253 RepID=A0AA43QPF4_9LECA|nr:hypothetical protein [Ramalina farinacea]